MVEKKKSKYDIIEQNQRLKKIALDLFEKCKSEELTIWEVEKVIELLHNEIAFQTKI